MLRNRIIKAATFEGATPRRLVTPELVAFHRRVAAGGAAMSTVAYCTVSPDGGTDGHQIVLNEESMPGLRLLTDAIHSEGAAACAQIGHAGPVANVRGQSVMSASALLTPALRRAHAATDEDISGIVASFARGARYAVSAGFDALEIHMGHNYLISAFLSRGLNRRRDRWGGSLENRARLARDVARAVREAAPTAAVTAKLNMVDGVPGGLDIEESVAVARMLCDDGTLDAIELTAGSSLANPMYLFRGDVPRREFAATLSPVLRAGFAVAGRLLFRRYPFHEAYLLPLARRHLAAVPMPLILLGGVTRPETIRSALDEGFAFVAMARALLREPDLVHRMRAEPATKATCTHCNKCVPTIYTGTRCALDAREAPLRR